LIFCELLFLASSQHQLTADYFHHQHTGSRPIFVAGDSDAVLIAVRHAFQLLATVA
jgi:hypothetical protein